MKWWLLPLAVLAGACSRQVTVVDMGTLERDTAWSGTVEVLGDVRVPPGVTLTVLPGTTVRFRRVDEHSGKNMFATDSPYFPQAELIVEGRLLAQGTAEEIIVFTSAERDAQPADWGGINLLGSEGSIVEYAKVLFAYNGVHAHGSRALISHNEFMRNGVAVSFKREVEAGGTPWQDKEAVLTITHNSIHDNKGGVNLRNAHAVISYNTLRENKLYGIWLKESADALVTFNDISRSQKGIFLYQATGATIRHNNLHDMVGYALAVAEEQDKDVDAAHNWFGTLHPERLEELLFDQQDDPAVGRIHVDPVLRDAVPGAGQ